MRLVPDQNWEKIAVLFEDYFRSIAPKCVKVDVKSYQRYQAVNIYKRHRRRRDERGRMN